ncbi:hypothetical protein [uncultured Dokdonia sp.]|uniref:hypothetical protein n=1 Tax=uncultured Dokdonia sp. TaxID=575653 RepID=UPI00262E587A|nr:hypothetical protein [uncultured Dokdonia sp.]
MKTLFTYFYTVLIAFCITSCETDVPETDTIAPSFSFKITGDGFDRTFTQDDDLEDIQLNLRAGISYDFLLGGIDQGGVRQIQFQHTPDVTPITTPIPSPWVEINNTLTTVLRFNGDPNNAITAQLLSGTFTATLGDDQMTFDTFYIRVEDFGGESGPPFNITEGLLKISIAEQPTAVINL